MRFHGGERLSWSRLERVLSGKPHPAIEAALIDPPEDAAENCSYRERSPRFAELHARSSYSFHTGASEPEELAKKAVELGLTALCLMDADGFYGVVRFAEAAAEYGLPTIFGSELHLPEGVLPLICRGPKGYEHLSQLICDAHMSGTKDQPNYPPLADIAARLNHTCIALIGTNQLSFAPQIIAAFSPQDLLLEYGVTQRPEDADAHLQLDHYDGIRRIISATPAAASIKDAPLAAAKHLLHHELSSTQPTGASWLRSGEEVAQLLPGRPELLATTCEIAEECAFGLNLIAPNLPVLAEDEMQTLRELTYTRAIPRYAQASENLRTKARQQIDYELDLIEKLGFPGYFLIVTDLVDFARSANILCQGRGSAANSVVCYALGITNVEPIGAGLLFERFLSPERDGPPDIDIDFESTRREEVIQYVYRRYGRDNAAQVANVITYRRRSALKDAARALDLPASDPAVAELAEAFIGQPRHLGIHSGGMVICDRPIAQVVPTEWARKENRSVVQWDKDDCAGVGLVKFDLLGLGMLEAIHHMMDLVAEDPKGRSIQLWEIPVDEPEVYEMLCRADAVGVFQVESRAQLSTLPRLRPRCFFDLVVEVALIRPGPIQGGSVHPYLRRRNGEEEVIYEHPVLEKSLAKTLGIPLFQEQLMQMAVDAAGFSAAEADSLRRAMGAKRSPEKMAALKSRFFTGLEKTSGIRGEVAESLWQKVLAFAAYGFPESHAQSFASLVYFSAWFKYHYPAHFCVGLLRAQPMGFYSPQSLISDARRHGVPILPISVNHSQWEATIVHETPRAIRLGLNLIKGLREKAGQRIAQHAPYASVADLSRKAELTVKEVEALAKAGALDCFQLSRREALWEAGVAETPAMLPGTSGISAPPALPGMSEFELLAADIASTGVTATRQPIEILREDLRRAGIFSTEELKHAPDGSSVRIAGVITHRQRPATASGVIFFGMEDETGLYNVVVSPGLWQRHRQLAASARALIIRGTVQNTEGAISVRADRLDPFVAGDYLHGRSRDFR